MNQPLQGGREAGDWSVFFPAGTMVLALPGWDRPRLLFPRDDLAGRWSAAGHYPAFRPGARAFRLLLRCMAVTGLGARRVDSADGPLEAFTAGAVGPVRDAVVLIGTPGAGQKLIVRLRDGRRRTLAFLKYAEKPIAKARIAHEASVLKKLPEGTGPESLAYGQLGKGDALLVTAVRGRTLRPYLPVDPAVPAFLDRLRSSEMFAIDAHPALRRMRDSAGDTFERLTKPLRKREWPVVFQHGDLAPWNLLRTPDGRLCAVDWEQAEPEGFPHLDLAYYVLQVAALMHRCAPATGRARAEEALQRQGLDPDQAAALVRLAALDAYARGERDEAAPTDPLQRWRRQIWEPSP